MDGHGAYPTVLPTKVDRETAPGMDAADAPALEDRGPRKGGQGSDDGAGALALEEKFHDGSCRAEIAVDLEGWAGVEEIGIGARIGEFIAMQVFPGGCPQCL